MVTAISTEGMQVRSAPHQMGNLPAHGSMEKIDTTAMIDPVKQQASRLIKIIIADDETIFRESLSILLQTKQVFEIVGACSQAELLLDMIRKANPDVVLLDSAIPQRDGANVFGEIRDLGMDVKVIVLCQTLTKEETMRALNAGVRGIIQKNDHTSSLIEAIHKVMQGEYWLGKAVLTQVVETLCSAGESTHDVKNKYGLTPREIQIIAAVLEGYSNPEIAVHLSLSEQTVKHHLSHVFDKLGVFSRVELALFAVNHRINGH
jgi:two-component system nitrate/nitrite response regulator NarL